MRTGATRQWSWVRGRWATGGFTLIEVLVVVAIIALLVAILMPSLQRARQQARRIVCGSNMRTCHQAMTLYLHSNADYFPWNADPKTPGGLPCGANPWEIFYKYVQRGTPTKFTDWERCPYVGTPDTNTFYGILGWYTCPNDRYYHITSEAADQLFPDGTHPVTYMLSYCVASSVCYISKTGPASGVQLDTPVPWKITTIKRQSDMVLFGEYGDDCSRMGGESLRPWVGEWELTDHNNTENQTLRFQIQHLEGCNVMYLDGHLGFSKLNMSDTINYGLPPYPAAFITNLVNCKKNANGQNVDEDNLIGRPVPAP